MFTSEAGEVNVGVTGRDVDRKPARFLHRTWPPLPDLRAVTEWFRQSAASAPPASFWRVVVWMAASVALTVTETSSALVSV